MSAPRTISAVLLGLVLTASATPSRAHFERFYASSRAFSLGGAYVALADDPAATVVNAAGLTQAQTPSFLATYSRPYELSDLEQHFLATAIPTRFGAFGLSWHRLGLRDVTSEDLLTLGYGRDLIRTSQDASLSVGGSVDVARVSFQDTYNTSRTKVTGSLSVLLRPFPAVGMGYCIRNLGEPTFNFVSGDAGTRLKMTHAIGVAWHWRERAVFMYERFREQTGTWKDALAIEIVANDELRMRGAIGEENVSGGFGVTWSGITFDVGAAAHNVLGMSYQASLILNWPSDREEPFP